MKTGHNKLEKYFAILTKTGHNRLEKYVQEVKMNITEYAKSREVDRNTVYKYIHRNKDKFNGMIENIGGRSELTELAIDILDKRYHTVSSPKKTGNISTEDYNRLRAKIEEMQNLLIILQEQIATDSIKRNEAEVKLAVITKILDDAEEQIKQQRIQLKEKDERIYSLEKELDETRKLLELERAVTQKQRLQIKRMKSNMVKLHSDFQKFKNMSLFEKFIHHHTKRRKHT